MQFSTTGNPAVNAFILDVFKISTCPRRTRLDCMDLKSRFARSGFLCPGSKTFEIETPVPEIPGQNIFELRIGTFKYCSCAHSRPM